MFASIAAVALLPALVAGQGIYGPPPPGNGGGSSSSSAPASAPSAPPSTSGQINVDVAPNGQFMFNPSNITASNGTLVTFFFPASGLTHSVTQSAFSNPCTHIAANGSTPAGFDSGLTMADQFTLNITNDQEPIWFHCKQITHCGLGMVGSINAPTSGSNTFQAFLAAAQAIGSNEVTETDNGPVTGGVGAVATAAPSATASGSSSGGSPTSGATSQITFSVGTLLLGVAAGFALV